MKIEKFKKKRKKNKGNKFLKEAFESLLLQSC